MSTDLVFIAGVVVFALSSLYFYLKHGSSGRTNSAMLVSVITLVSYCLYAAGVGSVELANGDTAYTTRWAGYVLSCTLLMWTIAEHIGLELRHKLELGYLTGITMLTGVFATLASGIWTTVLFVIGGFTYVAMMRIVWTGDRRKLGPIKKYIYFGWSVFPLVFILSPVGLGVVTPLIAAAAYLVLDIYSKIVFDLEMDRYRS